MTDQRSNRRLCAVLIADIAGYTRSVEKDTDGTVAAWVSARDSVIIPNVEAASGTIVKFTGDGFLVEFSSVVNAVRCAIAMQRILAQSPLSFRMGVNFGDVVDDGTDIHGEGVNIAARMEALAMPGGICISGDVYNQVRNQVDADYTELGPREVKNVSRPVHVYAIGPAQESEAISKSARSERQEARPSIAVLPFDNMSDSAEQEYFADGITEDIITELSRFQSLRVVSRNSSFVFKGKATEIAEVGRRLDVQYVVEGSVRKAGERIRVTAQLIEVASGDHVWAERFDRNLENIFEVQDEVTQAIASVLPTRIHGSRTEKALNSSALAFSAYDYLLKGRWLFENSMGENPAARDTLEKAIATEPTFALAHGFLVHIYSYNVFSLGIWYGDQEALAKPHVEAALKYGPSDPSIHAYVGNYYHRFGNFELAAKHIGLAMRLNPNDLSTAYLNGFFVAYSGDAQKGQKIMERCGELDPVLSSIHWERRAEVWYLLEDYEAALSTFREPPDPPPHTFAHMAACHAKLGDLESAKAAREKFYAGCGSDIDFPRYAANHARICKRQEDAENWLEGYRRAGLL